VDQQTTRSPGSRMSQEPDQHHTILLLAPEAVTCLFDEFKTRPVPWLNVQTPGDGLSHHSLLAFFLNSFHLLLRLLFFLVILLLGIQSPQIITAANVRNDVIYRSHGSEH
jgi:hypothetical protein